MRSSCETSPRSFIPAFQALSYLLLTLSMIVVSFDRALALPPEEAIAPYCTADDVRTYRKMNQDINEDMQQRALRGQPIDIAGTTIYALNVIKTLSKPCGDAISSYQDRPRPGGCTPRQIQKMIEANSLRGPRERAETNCYKYPP